MHQCVQCKNAQSYKGPYLVKYFSEFIQKLIRSSTHQYQSIHRFQSSSLNSFWDNLLTIFHPYFFSKYHNSGKGHNPDEKKKYVSAIFFMGNPYMKFQNPSTHSSKVMLCIKKHNGRSDRRTHKHPRSNMPFQLLRSLGHNKVLKDRWTPEW